MNCSDEQDSTVVLPVQSCKRALTLRKESMWNIETIEIS